jgi:hypothetical protein
MSALGWRPSSPLHWLVTVAILVVAVVVIAKWVAVDCSGETFKVEVGSL